MKKIKHLDDYRVWNFSAKKWYVYPWSLLSWFERKLQGVDIKKSYLLYYKKYNQKSLIFSTSRGKISAELNNSVIYFHLNEEKSLFYYFISRIIHEKPSNFPFLNRNYLKTYLHKSTLSLPDNYFCVLLCFINSFHYLPFYHIL